MKAIPVILLLFTALSGYSQNQDSVFYLQLFPGDPPCVDSLNLAGKYYYSCTHDEVYAINIEFSGDTLIVQEYEYEESDSLAMGREVERLFFFPEGNDIRLYAIQHNQKGKFRNDLNTYREGKVYRKKDWD